MLEHHVECAPLLVIAHAADAPDEIPKEKEVFACFEIVLRLKSADLVEGGIVQDVFEIGTLSPHLVGDPSGDGSDDIIALLVKSEDRGCTQLGHGMEKARKAQWPLAQETEHAQTPSK